MYRVAALLLALLAFGCGGKEETPSAHKEHEDKTTPAGHSHSHGPHDSHRPALTTLDVKSQGEAKAGELTRLTLAIPGADGKPVTNFEAVHDAKVHLIVVREGLDHFAHLHPEVKEGTGELTARYTFPLGGTYHLFADYKPHGKTQATAVASLAVTGEKPSSPLLTVTAPGTVKGDGLTGKVTLEGVKAGGEGRVRFELSGDDGNQALDLDPYMGAMGHLVVVSADAKRYVHAHPVEEKAAPKNVVAFEAHFAAPGLYKGWGQFKRGGKVRVVPFVIQVP